MYTFSIFIDSNREMTLFRTLYTEKRLSDALALP